MCEKTTQVLKKNDRICSAQQKKQVLLSCKMSPSCCDESLTLTTKHWETIKQAPTLKPYFTKQSQHLDFSTKSSCCLYKPVIRCISPNLWSWRVKQTQVDAIFENLPCSHGGGRFQHYSLKWESDSFPGLSLRWWMYEWKGNNLMFSTWKEKKSFQPDIPPFNLRPMGQPLPLGLIVALQGL